MCGLGIIIFTSIFDNFKECVGKEKYTDCTESELKYMPIDAPRTYISLIIIAITMCFCVFLPLLKCRTYNIGKWVPASLFAIIIASIWEHSISRPLMGIKTRTVGETCPIAGVWPKFHLPMISGDYNWNLTVIINYAIVICFVGFVENMLSL